MSFFRVNQKCNGCLACVQNCPASALDYFDEGDQRMLQHNMALCARCGQCWRVCPQEAVEFQHLLQNEWDEVVSLSLVRCQVCKEPLYSTDFERTLQEKTDSDIVHLCPKHRQRTSAKMWPKLAPGKSQVRKVRN
ncbi:MAG: 4Fe-4S dicluster domain-containing protein [Deltaproteobacteria bacterium]|nr:4Fe-4S dicluster domain-containing protein [Deltaproteobacteria bacterium]